MNSIGQSCDTADPSQYAQQRQQQSNHNVSSSPFQSWTKAYEECAVRKMTPQSIATAAESTQEPTFPVQSTWWAQTTELLELQIFTRHVLGRGGEQNKTVPQRQVKQLNGRHNNDQTIAVAMKANSNSGDDYINGNCAITEGLQQLRAADTKDPTLNIHEIRNEVAAGRRLSTPAALKEGTAEALNNQIPATQARSPSYECKTASFKNADCVANRMGDKRPPPQKTHRHGEHNKRMKIRA